MKRSLVVLFVLALSLTGFAQAECAAFPCVVASVALTDQTTPAEVPIFTPTESGLFRISFYFIQGARWILGFDWTDGHRLQSFKWYQGPVNQPIGTSLVVRGVAGRPLSYRVRKSQDNQGTYDLFITVEQLQ